MTNQPFTVPLLAHTGDEIAYINMQKREGREKCHQLYMQPFFAMSCFSLTYTWK
jgi:hypothetical protein